jgi:hypothetical protein
VENLVEPMGFEPTTSSMPSRRAPSCATAPHQPGIFMKQKPQIAGNFLNSTTIPSIHPRNPVLFSDFLRFAGIHHPISHQFANHVRLSSSFRGVCRYRQPASGAICWPRPQNPPNCLRSRDHVSSSNFRKFSRRALPTLQQTGSRAEHGYEERNGIARSPRRQSNGVSPDFSSFCAALPGLRKRICLQRKPDPGFFSGNGASCKSRFTSLRLRQNRPAISNLR